MLRLDLGLRVSLVGFVALCVSPALADEGEPSFREQIAPLLSANCFRCHNHSEKKGGLSLETAEAAMTGGESGQVIFPGDPDSSYLLDLVTPADGKAEMPKEGEPLTASEVATLRRWIAAGAEWPKDLRIAEPEVTGRDWWSLQPLHRPAVPKVEQHAAWQRTPVDAFIAAKLTEQGLTPAAEADRRTLIRRLYYDLVGLPPAPEAVDAFVADDDPLAYEKLVDRLLASPHYGERWARHWLDLVHYGDTHGYDKDKLRPHAWPYRDYVIRAFNEDKPYVRFVQEQIAGDALYPGTRDGIVALGFIAAGPWDYVGHAELPETKVDGQIARHLDRDDMVATTMNSFLSLTVQCAQCHNHKFDPVSQKDYYRLHAVFAALDRADRPYEVSPEVAHRRRELVARKERLESEHEEIAAEIRRKAGPRLVEVERRLDELSRNPAGKKRPEYGYHSGIEPEQDTVKWVQIDLGTQVPIEEIVLVGCHDEFAGIGAGFGFPVRFRVEVSAEAKVERGTVVADYTATDFPNPGITPHRIRADGRRARYVRVTATKLAPRKNDYIFALAELMVLSPEGDNAARGKPVTALDSIEAPVRWARANLTDGIYYSTGGGEESLRETARLKVEKEQILKRAVDDKMANRRETLAAALRETKGQLDALPEQGLVYAGTIHHGKGAFRGTGHRGGEPREIHVLHRGDVRQPREEVGPGTVRIMEDAPGRFELPPDHDEADRRAALARWLVRRDNPLLWRSIVNRVWQHHFGRGIVASPNDFGRMGQKPAHPQLLDWLAVEFRDRGQSFKRLHRLILTSSVYRQASMHDPQDAAADGANRFLWRQNRRRLDAEAIRDTVLVVSGKLDKRMGGPGFKAFGFKNDHSPHYKYHQYDPDDRATHRRAIYRFIVRSVPDPFMETLDCADPSQRVAKRDQTLTALQALSLLNNKFMVRMAEHFAARVSEDADTMDEQVRLAFRLALAREPSGEELRLITDVAKQHGLANACRLIFNTNEFMFVD